MAKSIEQLERELAAARLVIVDLTRDRDHWKANHENEVRRAKVLKTRLDMPLERISAYNLIGQLQAQVAALGAGEVAEPSDSEAALFMRQVRDLMGYIENGTDTTVRMFQDDATRTFHVRLGSATSSLCYWSHSLADAVKQAWEVHCREDAVT